MRKSLLGSTLGLVLTLALTTTALAAPATGTIGITFSTVTREPPREDADRSRGRTGSRKRKAMRKSVLGSTLGLVLTLALTTTALAAPATGTIGITFSTVTFSSILGGQISGNGSVSGDISDAGLSGLRGTANLPLRDARLSIEPTGALVLQSEQMNVQWNRSTCNQFGCFYEYGFSTFERRFGAGPIEIRLGQLRGTGTLSLGTNAACVASCPPPGSYWYAPTGFVNLSGAVIGNDDAGHVQMYGPAPTIY